MNNKVVTVITAESESCDSYGPWVFETRPSDEQLQAFLRENVPQEFDDDNDGPGIFGSYLHITITERTVLSIPSPPRLFNK